jgi:hypothetical protein
MGGSDGNSVRTRRQAARFQNGHDASPARCVMASPGPSSKAAGRGAYCRAMSSSAQLKRSFDRRSLDLRAVDIEEAVIRIIRQGAQNQSLVAQKECVSARRHRLLRGRRDRCGRDRRRGSIGKPWWESRPFDDSDCSASYVSVVWTRPVKRKVSFMTVHRPFRAAASRGYRGLKNYRHQRTANSNLPSP